MPHRVDALLAELARGVTKKVASIRAEANNHLSAPHATLFAVGAVGTGLATMATAVGVLLALKPGIALRLMGSVALLSAGLASATAGVYPMPDARDGGGAIGAGLFLLPFLLPAHSWSSAPTWARAVLLGGVAWFIVAGMVMRGATAIDQLAYEGICNDSSRFPCSAPSA